MAEVMPFVATRFSNRNGEDLARVLTPPYDVIDAKMQQGFYESDPHNIVRIDFGRENPSDTEFENRYSRSGETWKKWKSEGVIAEDPKKSFYVYEQEFALPDGRVVRRRGFFAAVKLEDFSEGGIRAHEHTFDGPKADRFRLMRATHSNMSPIFCLYDDPACTIDQLIAAGIEGQQPIECAFGEVTQRLWTLCKPSVIEAIRAAMAKQTLFIADGHHRYETSLLYRDEMRQALRQKNGRQPYDYTLMYLNNIHDEGLVILPTHRVLSREACMGTEIEEILEDLREFFDVEPLKIDMGDLENEARRVMGLLATAGEQGIAFIMSLCKGRAFLLKLKPDADLDAMIDEEDVSPLIKRLDVTILHRYIINHAWLGNPEIELDDQDVNYVKDAAQALSCMSHTKWGVAFLLNPTRIEQVCEIARAGMRMPHKSTYFYPKLVTGMVMRDMNSPW